MTIASSVRLRTRLITLGLIATAPALIVILYTQSLERDRARESAVADVRKVTQLAASQQATMFDGVQRLLLTMAQLPEIQSDDPARCRALLPGVLRDHPGYINIWVDKPGDVRFCEAIPIDAEPAPRVRRRVRGISGRSRRGRRPSAIFRSARSRACPT